jgi:hypothetical protein
MRIALLLAPLAIVPVLAFAACSSSSSTDGTTSSTDAGSGSGKDAGSSGGGNKSDGGGGGGGGTDAGTGGGGDDSGGGTTPTCDKPSDCSGSGDVCCGTIPITGGSVPNCTTDPIMIACTPGSMCKTSLGMSCSGTQIVRLCTANSDCTESGANQCCTFSGGDGGSLSFCTNGLISAFGGGKCM